MPKATYRILNRANFPSRSDSNIKTTTITKTKTTTTTTFKHASLFFFFIAHADDEKAAGKILASRVFVIFLDEQWLRQVFTSLHQSSTSSPFHNHLPIALDIGIQQAS